MKLLKTLIESWTDGDMTFASKTHINKLRAEREADRAASRQRKEDDKVSRKAIKQEDKEKAERMLLKLAQQIDAAIGDVYPDGDPYDVLAEKYPSAHHSTTLIDLLDKAVRKHLNGKDFNSYVDSVHKELERDGRGV